jgi:Tetratricopeptide repeat
MTGRSSPRQKVLVIAGVIVLLGGSLAGAIVTAGARREQMRRRDAPPPVAATTPAATAPAPPPTAAAELRGPAPPSAPVAAAPTAPAPEPPAAEPRAKRHATVGRLSKPSSASVPVSDVVNEVKPPAPTALPAPNPEPAARGVREVLAEAEKFLAQGEVTEACARGEEANRIAPKSAPVHKLLGKCYMRAGRTREANDNYKQYLELAPNAPDAPFVKSMIK